MQSHIRKVYACLAVTCHLRFWQDDRGLLRATAVTRGWDGYRNKSQHRKLTLEKKILPPLHPYLLACWLHLLGMLHVFAEVHAAALAVSVHVCNVAALSFSTNAERNNQHHRVRKRGWKKNEKNNDTRSLVSAKDSGKRWRGTNAGMKRKKREEKEKEKKKREKNAPRIPP